MAGTDDVTRVLLKSVDTEPEVVRRWLAEWRAPRSGLRKRLTAALGPDAAEGS